MNKNNINFQVHRTTEGTICEAVSGLLILLSLIFSIIIMYHSKEAGSAMLIQTGIIALSVVLILVLAYAPHTFNIPDDSPASVFLATIRMIRIIALMSAVLSLGITLCALFGYEPSVLLAVYVAVIVVATGWYLLKIKRKKST
jgi:hypothetical protein